jgi:hypothetical protein
MADFIKRTVWLNTPQSRQRAHVWVDAAPDGWIAKFSEPTRTDEQNKKLWPMLADIQCQVPGMEAFSAEDMKLRFLNALGVEMRFLPALEGAGSFPVGLRSSTLTVDQFSALIELLYEFGARHGVVWTDPETRQQARAA